MSKIEHMQYVYGKFVLKLIYNEINEHCLDIYYRDEVFLFWLNENILMYNNL